MPRFLSAEWVAGVQTAATNDERLRAATADVALTIQHVVHRGPEGETTYHVVIDHGTVAIHLGPTDSATVTFESGYETAAAVSQGRESAQGALMQGRIRARGDLARLAACQEAFAGLDDVFRSVRESTVYSAK